MAENASSTKNLKKKVVASGVVLAAGAALLSGGIYAGWTSEATTDQDVQAVDLSAGFIETGGADNIFQNIEDAFPGDYWTRYATLANNGTIDQDFTVQAITEDGELTAPADGLRALITTCTVAFNVGGGCEEGDQTHVPASGDPEGEDYVPAHNVANLDDDAVTVLADGFITDVGRMGSNVHVPESDELFFKIVYVFDEDADQATFEGKVDTALVRVDSLTAKRAGEDRTDG